LLRGKKKEKRLRPGRRHTKKKEKAGDEEKGVGEN